MKRVDDYLAKAIRIVTDVEIAKDGVVNNQYKGYVASFGTAVIHVGVKPAVAMFSDENKENKGRSEEDPTKITKAIFRLVKPENDNSKNLLEFLCKSEFSDTSKLRKMEKEILNAAIALKLAIRTYKIK